MAENSRGHAPGTLDWDDIALKCINDLKEKIESIPQFEKRIFHVMSEDDVVDQAKNNVKPCVGLYYTGMTGGTEAQGLDAELGITVILIGESRSQLKVVEGPNKVKLLEWLGQLRRAIRMTPSPSAHKWRFRAEIPVGKMGGFDAFFQRWTTKVMLSNPATPANRHFGPAGVVR